MAKFRSWMIHEFYYWKDGDYYLDVDCKRKNKYLDLQESGFWKNSEQSTGMVDKNGREIFENDIAKIKYKGKTIDVIVRFNGLLFTLYNFDRGLNISLQEYCNTLQDIEIIGNIHEGKSK